MSLPAEPATTSAILETLADFRSDDAAVHGGRVLAYVYDAGIPDLSEVATAALTMYAGVNGLDPTVFPSVARIENDLVGWGLDLLGGPPGAQGVVTSGGTESCLLAVKAAREDWRRRQPGSTATPALIMGETAHPAFAKAATYLGLEIIRLPVDPETFKVRPADVAAALADAADRVVLVVASAPSYAHGVVDPVAQIAEIARAHDVPLHTDACIGGWVLPYLVRGGEELPGFDLSVPGVRSISVDLHKYGYAPKGTSLLLFSDADYRLGTFFTYSSWPGYPVVNTTTASTKSAGPPAAAWAVLRRIGDTGFAQLVASARRASIAIADAVAEIPGLQVLAEPEATLVALGAEGPEPVDPFVLCDEMAKRGWFIQAQPGVGALPRSAHLTVQATTEANMPELLAALTESATAARGRPPAQPDPELIAVAESLDLDALDLATVTNLLVFAGLDVNDGPRLPEDAAPVQALLEALPVGLRNTLLAGYFSAIFTATREGPNL